MQFFNKVLIKLTKLRFIGQSLVGLLLIILIDSQLQSQPPNYSTWQFRDGNLSATKRNSPGYILQNIDSFVVKWSTPFISGDVNPLIGNILMNKFPGVSDTEPLEMVSLIGDELILINGAGKLLKKQKLPVFAQNVKQLTVLFDSLETSYNEFSRNTLLIGSESIEFFNPNSKDTIAHSYIFGYDADMDSLKVVKRLSMDLRQYKPNVSCSIKPFYGRRVNGRLMVYTIIDMSNPIIKDSANQSLDTNRPYFRGFAQFYDDDDNSIFPLPDVKDQSAARIHLSGDVGLYQPSIKLLANNLAGVLLPYQHIDTKNDSIFRNFEIKQNVNGANYNTIADSSYLIGFNLNATGTASTFAPKIITPSGTRPIIRPVYAELTDANGSLSRNYILVAEQYSGIDGSEGESRIHLYNASGTPITSTLQSRIPPLKGGRNHYWSIGVGNVDGVITNTWSKYFPNNRGNEIIITQSTKESVYPESRLFIMKYNTGLAIEKPVPSGDTLFPFDTIITSRVNGWLAAVSDIDLHPDGKDEILLVDGSTLMVLRMRDYSDINFRLGYPFDTVMVKHFSKQTISNVAIADLEGDGKPEIIVSTYDSTYVIGSIIPNTLSLECPTKNGVSSFCENDTITLKWSNIIISQQSLRLKFERVVAGTVVDTILLNNFVENLKDSMSYNIQANKLFFNGLNEISISGRFILEGREYPDKLNSTSCIININRTKFNLTSTIPTIVKPGDLINFTADVVCGDSVSVLIYDNIDTLWQNIGKYDVSGNLFDLNYTVPCLLNMFNCSDNISLTRNISFMFITENNGLSDTVSINNIRVIPRDFSITIDPKLTADPSLYIRWDPSELSSIIPCDTVSISASSDGGQTFFVINNSNINERFYKWIVPYNVPNSLILRLCCNSYGCIRKDTVITDITPKYINIIAPNPFNPNLEQMEFVYKVNENTNITVRIFDQSNRLVKDLIKNSPRSANLVYTDRWDGSRNDGSLAANGLYYLIFELSDGSREIHQIFIAK